MTIQSISLFPTLAHLLKLDEYSTYKDELCDWFHRYRDNTEGVQKSNKGGYQSPLKFYYEDSFIPYKNILEANVKKLEQMFDNCSLRVKNAWFNINYPGCFNVSHTHPQSDLSGVWWIDVPSESGVLQFESPHEHNQSKLIEYYKKDIKEALNMFHSFYLTPQDGTMVFFPSELRHFVDVNLSSQARISVAFNIEIVGNQ